MEIIPTGRMSLVPYGADRILKLIEGAAAFSAACGVQVAAGWLETPEVLPWFLDTAQRFEGTDDAEWNVMRGCELTEEAVLIGGCGFKGSPDAEGRVEIGYGIATAYRCRGFATEAAAALVAQAFECPRVLAVTACTQPGDSPSTAVLRKCGFTFAGEDDHPEEGRIWRWTIAR